MSLLAALGLVMLVVMIFVIFIGFPISFTLLFLALTFGYFGLGEMVFSLAYFQTIGMMKEELLAAVPLFIFMGFLTEQAGLWSACSSRCATFSRRSGDRSSPW